MPVHLDRTRAPIFVTTSSTEASEADWRRHLDELTTILERARPYAFVVDARNSKERPHAGQRRIMAEWMRAHDAELRAFCRGGAFVMSSPVIRGVVTAIHWVSPPPYPFATFAKLEEAIAWCQTKLTDQG